MFSLFFFILACASTCYGSSQIALFTDTNCKNSLRGVEGPNGYPNGTCTDLRRSGEYGSFQVVHLDPGCGVTIYVDDPTTTICGGAQEEVQLAGCHNNTFVYYSFDFCTPPGAKSSTFPSSDSSTKPPIAAIVGGVVGGVAGLAVIVGIAFLLGRKKRAQNKPSYSEETDMKYGRQTFAYQPYAYPSQELPSNTVVYKNMPSEAEQPPVELAGNDIQRPNEGHEIRQSDAKHL